MRVGTIELKVLKNAEYRGNKKKVGSIVWDSSGKMCMFLGYTPCCKAKMAVSRGDCEELARRYHFSSKKLTHSFIARYTSKNKL